MPSAELTYLCVACGHQWDAAEVTIDLPRRVCVSQFATARVACSHCGANKGETEMGVDSSACPMLRLRRLMSFG